MSFFKSANPPARGPPMVGIFTREFLINLFIPKYPVEVLKLPRCFEIPHVLGEIDIPLSFKITITLDLLSPMLLRPS